jgi:hypothetical protein
VKQPVLNVVTIEEAERTLFHGNVAAPAADQLYDFGKVLFAESLQRIARTDSKLTNLLGWSAAILVVASTRAKGAPSVLAGIPVATAALLAFISIIACVVALKTGTSPAPSEQDWFQAGLLADAGNLRRYHIVSLLLTHQVNMQDASRKAEVLRRVEWLTVIASFGAALNIFS